MTTTTRSTWHSSRISCGRMPMLNAFCGSRTKRLSPPTSLLHPPLTHSARIHCAHCEWFQLLLYFFFQLSIHPSIQASKQATNVPSIRQWQRDALEAIISITFQSWFMASIEFWLTISQAFKVSVSRIRYLRLFLARSLSLPTWQSDFKIICQSTDESLIDCNSFSMNTSMNTSHCRQEEEQLLTL